MFDQNFLIMLDIVVYKIVTTLSNINTIQLLRNWSRNRESVVESRNKTLNGVLKMVRSHLFNIWVDIIPCFFLQVSLD